MEVKKNTTFLMLKIKTPPNIDFLAEHKKIIDKTGEVWFCRFGKTNIVHSKITNDGNFIFFKDSAKNNNRVYIGIISKISLNSISLNYPKYYNYINMNQSFWICLSEIKEVNPSLIIQNFRIKSNNAKLLGVYHSICNSFYIKCITNIKL